MVSRSVAGAARLARASSASATAGAGWRRPSASRRSATIKLRMLCRMPQQKAPAQDRQQDRSVFDESCGSRGACLLEALRLHHDRAREEHLLVQGAKRCLPVRCVRLKGLFCHFLARQWQATSVVSSGLRRTDGRSSLRSRFPVSTSAAADKLSVVSLLSAHGASLI